MTLLLSILASIGLAAGIFVGLEYYEELLAEYGAEENNFIIFLFALGLVILTPIALSIKGYGDLKQRIRNK